MPAEHVRTLIAELHPGVSVRQLVRAAGAGDNLIAYWLRPGTDVKGIPSTDTCKEIARVLGCDTELVVEAFAADSGTPLPQAPRPNADEERLLWMYRRMTVETREVLARAMVNPDATELLRRYTGMSADDQFAVQQIARSITGGV
jgi:hypothetical protein